MRPMDPFYGILSQWRSLRMCRRARLVFAISVLLLVSPSVWGLDDPSLPRGQDAEKHAPDEVLLKFKPEVAAHILERTGRGGSVDQLKLPDSLNKVMARHRVERIAPVFEDFAAARRRCEQLPIKNKANLTPTERRLLRRQRRAPPDATIPDLDHIFKLKLAPGISVESAVDELNANPNVEYAEPNYLFHLDSPPNDPYFGVQWSLNNTGQPYPVSYYSTETGTPDSDVDAPEAWDVYTPSYRPIVAVIDSGVDYTHRDLVANMWTDNQGFHGYDFVNDDPDPMDDLGHGTHIAGIIGAVSNNGIGISGLCPDALIMALKFTDENGEGTTDHAAQAIYYAVDHGADVISNSYSNYTPSTPLKEAIEYAYSQGAMFIASAGNEGTYTRRYPAAYDHVVAVASIDANDAKASSSSYGTWVDLSAPGVDILSLRADGTDMYRNGRNIFNTFYYIASGTSMACPHAAGTAALIASHFPNLPADEIVTRLLGTTDEIVYANESLANLLGTGRVNALSALSDPQRPAITIADADILDATGGNGNGALEPGETVFLRVTLKNGWADAFNVAAILGSSNPFITIQNGLAFYGSVASGQKESNEGDLLEISLSLDAPTDDPVAFSLLVSADGGYSKQLGFSSTVHIPLQDGAWPNDAGGYVEPIAFDVDGDGLQEIIIPNGPINIYKPDGALYSTLSEYEIYWDMIAVGDLQNDGHADIVALEWDLSRTYLHVWDKNGNAIAPPLYPNPEQTFGKLALFDLDGDGDLEIITGGWSSSHGQVVIRVVRLQSDRLEIEWEVLLDVQQDLYKITEFAIGDIDASSSGDEGSGTAELIFSVYGNRTDYGAQVFALTSTGDPVDGWPVQLPYAVGGAPALADLTGDGNLEIVVDASSQDVNGLRALTHDGALLWSRNGEWGHPVIADLDSNGDLEVVTQRNAYRHDGAATGWSYDAIVPRGASVGDINGDMVMDVLLGGSGGDGVRAFRFEGLPVAGFPLFIDSRNRHASMTPVLTDLDGDGDIEIVAAGIYLAVWDLKAPYDPLNIEWPMFRHDTYRSGNYNANINHPPVWNLAPEDQVFVRGIENELCVRAGDPERKTVSYDIAGVPVGAEYDADSSGLSFRWNPLDNDSEVDLSFGATDADGKRVEKTIHIELSFSPFDMTGDGDFDLSDHRQVLHCFNGPNQPWSWIWCEIPDTDHDRDIDLIDLATLQNAFTGPR